MGQQQLSGTIVLIIIAVAVQVCIMLVIIVKRQIMRFALRNRRGPHSHIGQGAPKALRREIDRRLDYVALIQHEPQLKPALDHDADDDTDGRHGRNASRVAAIAEMKCLEYDVAVVQGSYLRPPCTSLRSFLLKCLAGPLRGADSYFVHQVCDDYEHARHHFEDFGSERLHILRSRIEFLRQRLEANQKSGYDGVDSAMEQFGERKKKAAITDKGKCKSKRHDSRLRLLTSSHSPNCTAV